ncbi:MAG: HDOD domain-containing protein [Anaerolineaceae bacterium]|nr:HDOD domain-containing protein [Anaerolineaceae bacterium]
MPKDASAILDQCPSLPTAPAIALEVLRLSQKDDVDLREIADVISCDAALSGRILSAANSAYYGLPGRIATVGQAVIVLGLSGVKTLALGFSLAESISSAALAMDDLQAFWRRSLHFAGAARTFADRKMPALREEAFTAGLLADVGSLAMSQAFGSQYADFCISTDRTHADIIPHEQQRFELDHQQISRAITESWRLPQLLAVPIAHHHDPQNVGGHDSTIVDLAHVLHAANLCADVLCGAASADMVRQFEAAVKDYLGLDSDGCRVLLENLQREVQEVAGVLDIEIPESTSYGQIIQRANRELARLSLQTQQQARQAECTHKEAASRLEALEKSNRQLVRKANTDPLTGVYNRRFMEGFIECEIARAARFRRPLSMLFIDIDNFKAINDTHGHLAGDAMLRQLANLLAAATRDVDCLCRYGGEEFMLTLLETDLQAASHLAEKLRRLVAAWKFQHDGLQGGRHMTISIGVATMNPNRPIDKDLLIQMADESLYAAKRDGRNCVCALRKRVSPLLSEGSQEEPIAPSAWRDQRVQPPAPA